MIELCAPPRMGPALGGGWELLFLVCDTFNYATPFRAMLAEMADALGQNAESDLQLPTYEEYEDFVEGTLQFGLVPLRVYYEHSISYFKLFSEQEAPLHDVVERIQSRIAVV